MPMPKIMHSQPSAQIRQLENRLKATERLNEQLFESSPNCVKVLDLEGRLLRMNVNGLRALELDDFEPYREADWLSFWGDEYRPAAQRALLVAKAGQTESFRGAALTVTGKLKWWDVMVSPIFDEQQQVEQLLCISQDVSDRIQSERTIRAAQLQLESALFAGQTGTWHYDLVTNLATTGPHLAMWFGIEPKAAAVGLPIEHFLEAIHPQDRARVTRAMEISIDSGEAYKCEYRVVDANGEERYVLAQGKTEYSEAGQPLSFSGAIINITQRRQAEKDLEANEQHVRNILDSLFSFVGVVSSSGILLEANRTALEAAALTPEAVIGKPFDETYWWSHSPEAQARLRAAIEQAKLGETVRFDAEVLVKNRRLITIDFTLVPVFDTAGELEYLIPSGIDVTEQRQAALQKLKDKDTISQQLAEIEAIYHNAPVGLTILDRELRFVRLNQQLADMNGLSVEAHLGRTVGEVIPEMADTVEPIFQDILATGEPRLNLEIRGETPAQPGTERVWLGSWYPIKNARDETIGINVVAQEITERKQAEQEKEELLTREKAARAEAEYANRMKDEFLAVVSHELRTPLNPILGWSQLLAQRKLSEEKKAYALETIMRSAKMQAQLIDDLLDVSRILRGKLSLAPEPVRLATITQAAMETVQLSAQAKSIEICTHFDPDTKPVLGDAGRLQQIVWNILSNAIKFTPDGGKIDVHIKSAEQSAKQSAKQSDSSRAQIVIQDTGKGISADFLPYLFDRFRQQDSATTRKFGGLGLGLAICRHLVELHGGNLFAESPGEGHGSTFIVELPVMHSSTNVEVSLPTKIQTLNNNKVLVIDDHEDAREVATVLLEDVGASVVTASSAREALDILQHDCFNIIVSDIGMPEIDGYQLLKEIRALPSEQENQTPAICLTAYAGEFDLKRAREAGFQKHVAKPVEQDVLLGAIIAAIQSDSISNPVAY